MFIVTISTFEYENEENSFLKGILIPNLMHKVEKLKSNARIVLIVEKHATFMRLIDDNFLNKYPAILITVQKIIL